MTFEIKNPNYSREALEQTVAAVINRHDSGDDSTSETQSKKGVNDNVA